MATKQTSLRANKQAKRQQRAKQKQVTARKEEAKGKQLIGRREMAKLMTEPGTGDGDIAGQARRRLKNLKKRVRQGSLTQADLDKKTAEYEEITNTMVMQNINDVIPAIIRIHSGIEVFTRLAAEKRFEISPEEQALINSADEQFTHITEDINAIVSFAEAKKEPEDYMEIFMHYTELLARTFEVTVPAIMLMLTPQTEAIDAYAQEHRNKELPMFEFMRGLHIERMDKVFMTYRTQVSPGGDAIDVVEHAYTPENPMPMDPVIDEDVTDAVLAETPDLEKDVLAEPSNA